MIAAVNGWALAGGLEMALACDIRIASERARFGSFEARRGYHHGDGGIVRLVNACGVGVASHMLLTAEPIDAAQALQWNLVTKVVAARRADGRGRAGRAARSCATPSARCAAPRRRSSTSIGKDLDDQLRTEAWNAYTVRRSRRDAGPAAALLRPHGRGPRMSDVIELFPPGAAVDEGGELVVGGCRLRDLAAEFGTPAYVVDEAALRARAREYRDELARAGPTRWRSSPPRRSPAPRCCACSPRRAWAATSPAAGELVHALAAGVDPGRIYLHGNAKTDEDLQRAIDAGVGTVVIDNFDDIDRLERLRHRRAGACSCA